jgi:AraC-like DNA-binding protein
MHAESTYLRYFSKVLQTLNAQETQAGSELFELLEEVSNRSMNEQSRLLADLFSRAARLPGARDLGFRLGRTIPMTAFGPLTMGYRIAPTVGDGLRLLADGSSLKFPLVEYSFQRRASSGWFDIRFRYAIDEAGEAFFVAAAVAILQKDLQALMPRSVVISRLELTSASAGYEALYRQHLSIRPKVGAKCNRITIPSAVLDAASPSADIETFEQMAQAQAEAARSRRRSPRMREIVMERIATRIDSPPTLADIASGLNLTERQLRFALLKNDTSYRALLREARIEQAEKLLCGTGMTVSQVAERLGYADVAAFSHSFQRWTGTTPSDVQRRGGRAR